jgi:Tir chaperone protein (CesT) family
MTMNSSDAMVILVGAFPLDGVMADTQGNLAHLFGGDFPFAATDIDDSTLRLSAQLDGLSIDTADLARRLLEANLTGVETGAGAMAPDPVGSGLYALVDTVPLAGFDADYFRLRVVDFMLYVEYWRSEGVAAVRAAFKQEVAARSPGVEAIMVRA